MIRLVYDGTFEGLLTTVFEIYDRKIDKVNVQKGEWNSSALFEEVIKVFTDENRADRVLKGLRQKLSANAVQRLYIAHLADIENADNSIVNFMRYAFDSRINIEEDYGNENVLRISEIVTMMRREKHRMEAFIRFKKLKDDSFYAEIEPDFNVIPMLIRHFKNRYADQKFIIYDIKRKYGIYYDLHDVEFILMEFSEEHRANNIANALCEDEGIYQHLWKNYFTSVNIVSRKNTKLHIRHIPKRYWKHLTEKI